MTYPANLNQANRIENDADLWQYLNVATSVSKTNKGETVPYRKRMTNKVEVSKCFVKGAWNTDLSI